MALTLATVGLIYAACVLLHHAHPKRTAIGWVKHNDPAPRLVRIGAVVLLVIAQWVLAFALGWERGIPVLLAAVAGAGALSLIGATLAPRTHIPVGIAALAVGVFSACATLMLHPGVGASA